METKRKKLIIISLLSSIFAVVLHGYLSIKYYGLKFGISNSSLCNINQKFNCDVASTSSFADILGVPIALLGLLTHLVLIVFILNGFLTNKDSERPFRYGYLLSLFVLLTSIVMGIISILFLTSYCPFCIATYVLSLIGFLAYHFSFTPNQRRFNFAEDFKSLFTENKASLYTLAAIPLLGLFINWNIQKNYTGGRLDTFIQESLSIWKQRKEFPFDLSKGLIKGPEDAKFVIVEFADYLCPHCKTALTPLKTFIAGHQNAKLVYKPYPLDANCNPGLNANMKGDGIRCRLAYSVYCAQKEFNQGWEYHEFIFENQEFFHGVTSHEGVDKKICELNSSQCDSIKKCLDTEEPANWVKSASKEGSDAEITGTPTIYVNGKKLEGGGNLMVLKALYQELNL